MAHRQRTIAVVDQMLNDPLNVVGKTEEMRLLQEELRTSQWTLTRRLDYGIAAYHASQTEQLEQHLKQGMRSATWSPVPNH